MENHHKNDALVSTSRKEDSISLQKLSCNHMIQYCNKISSRLLCKNFLEFYTEKIVAKYDTLK